MGNLLAKFRVFFKKFNDFIVVVVQIALTDVPVDFHGAQYIHNTIDSIII